MKGIVDVTENIKTKKNGTQRSMWRTHGPLLNLQKSLLILKLFLRIKIKHMKHLDYIFAIKGKMHKLIAHNIQIHS